MAFRGIDRDPIRNFKFKVQFDSARGGLARSGFSRVSGLKETTEIVEYREGTDPGTPRKLFGQASFDNVTLERGIGLDVEWIEWRRDIVDVQNRGRDLAQEGATGGAGGGARGGLLRREVSVVLGDFHAEQGLSGAWTWTLLEAWPTSLEIGEVAGDGNEVVLETVELTHEGLNVTPPG